MTQSYVCGFCFDHKLEQVALIWKNKPAWQKGKLNGIGGKIEPFESPVEAMEREFKEETGLEIIERWLHLVNLSGDGWHVTFFFTKTAPEEFEYITTMEDEEVAKIPVDSLDDFAYIDNLRWLIPMALYQLKNPSIFISI